MKKILLYTLLLLFVFIEAKSQDCTGGTILFKEDFGGNLVEDPDHSTIAIPECEFIFKADGDPRGAGNYAIRKEGWYHGNWWTHMDDHTYPNDKTRGYLMQVDASATPGQFFKRQIDDLCAGVSLYFSVWAANSINQAYENRFQKASLSFVIEDINGNVLLTENTGLMPGTTNDNDWNQYGATFTVPLGQSSIVFKILNNGNSSSGNDLVLDDIEVRLCVPPTSVIISPNDTVCKDQTVTLAGQFTNDGTFTEPLTYKWFKSATASYNQSDWTEITTGQTFTISSAQSSDAGFYRVAVASVGSIDMVNCRSMSDIVSLVVQDCQVTPNYPDNIENINCFVDPQTIAFSIKELARSATEVSLLTNPLCGDIDDDGEVEILVLNARDLCGGGTARVSDAILVYGYNIIKNELYLKYTIPIPYSSNFMIQSPIAIAKIDGSRYASVFYASKVDEKLYKYDFDGTQYRTTWSTVYIDNINYAIVSPSVTDLMSNGRTQICILDKIIDTRTGNILASGNFIPPSGVSNYSFGLYGHMFNSNHESMMIPIDVDNDGIKEIIGGDCVYGVQLVNFDTNVGNKFILKQRASTMGHTEIGDGGTAIADIDNDGLLDVVVSGPSENNFIDATKGSVYVYSPQSGEIKNNNVISDIPISNQIGGTFGPSRPFIGDVDADGFSEICLTGESVLNCYKYNIDEKKMSLVWSLPTHDSSGSTTLTMFDFIQDGKARLVYRDEKILQIINASVNPPVIEAMIDKVESPTINEFPIVADVNGDGAAEIIVTGRNDATSASNWCWAGELRVYTSATEPWAPARQVWNQSAYNSVNVNADLTIPQYQFNPATVFPGKDGLLGTIDDVRPYNNFLQQQTLLNPNGNAVWESTDYKIENNIVATCLGDNRYELSFGVSNVSELEGADTLNIGYYSDDIHTQLIGISLMKKQIQAEGSCTFIDTITTTAENLYIRLNDRGKNFPDNYLRVECDYTNNMGHVVLPWCGTDPPCFNDTTYINGEVCLNDSYVENGFNLPVQTEAGEKIFSLNLLSQNGCDSIVQLNLLVLPKYETARQVFIEQGESIQIDNKTYSFPTEVISTYMSVSGCDSVIITTINWKPDSSECDELIPDKYFSPNNDNIQDTWNIKNIECYDGYLVEIFDRFSKLLIRYEGNFTPWDGIYSGHPEPNTDYWYVITLKEGETLSGHFILKR